MKIIIPQDVTDATLFSSSIPENDYPAWAMGTTYARGDFVISTATHTVYRSLTDANTGNDPDLEQVALADPLIDDPDPIRWQIIGATNRWRMFDKKPSVQATAADQIEVVIKPLPIVGGIAGFGIEANSVTVTGYSPGVTAEVFNRTIEMRDESLVVDWYSYYFAPITPLTEFVITDLPPYGDLEVTVTIDKPGATVRCGQIVIGGLREIGITKPENTGFTGLDFSYVQQDDFGDLTTVRRAATRLSQFEVLMANATLLGFDRLMRDLRGGVAAVWIGDGDARKAAINYGFYRDYRTVYQTSDHAILSLQIQGIV
ncbi:MAG: hypothetical protein LPK02_10235 [Rhodobacterales bacterium]|nr:hypothetical protein [Rhodobacterales bacterium]